MLGASLKSAFRHPNPSLQSPWNYAQVGLLIFPLSPLLGVVALVLALLGTWLRQYHTITHRPQNLGFALLGVLFIVTTGFAFDKNVAFLGLFNFLPFILFFAGFSVLIQTTAQLRQLSWILLITSIPVVTIGLGQLFFGWTTPHQWEATFGWAIAPKGNPPGRMASIFMYANTLAGYLVMVFILGLGLWLEAYRQYREQKRTSGIGQWARGIGQGASGIGQGASGIGQGASGNGKKTNAQFPIPNAQFPIPNAPYPLSLLFLTVVVSANFVALILTNSRNAWAIALFACLAYAVYQGWRILVAGVAAIATSVLLAAFAPSSIAALFRKVVPAFFWARLNDQLYPDRPLGLLRKTQWQFAWSLAQQRPWTGWGLRNFTQLYQAQMHIWLGHPHNLFLMLSAETGLPATILFCALLSWIFIAGVQLLRNSKYLEQEDKLIFFSYLLVFGAWVLFNTVDVTLFDFRLNTLSWLLLAAISGVVYRYGRQDKLTAN